MSFVITKEFVRYYLLLARLRPAFQSFSNTCLYTFYRTCALTTGLVFNSDFD